MTNLLILAMGMFMGAIVGFVIAFIFIDELYKGDRK